MKERTIIFFISIIIIALIGIISIQLLWINNIIEINKKQFEQTVNETLLRISEKLELKETIVYFSNALNDETTWTTNYELKIITENESEFGHQIVFDIDSLVNDSNNEINVKKNEKNEISVTTSINRENIIKDKDEMIFLVKNEYLDSAKNILIDKIEKGVDNKVHKLRKVIHKMAWESEIKSVSINQRLKKINFDSIVVQEFKNSSIDIPVHYRVFNSHKNKTEYIGINEYEKKIKYPIYKTKLFPTDIISKSYELQVYFPNQTNYLYRSILGMAILSLIFILLIAFVFLHIILTVLKQKKISEMKSDFINNMTHEFKTPIATISLAVDSIKNRKIFNDKSKYEFFTRKIKEENNRMHNHVEQILQMAVLEKNKIKLNREFVDIHELLFDLIDNFSLQISDKNGSFTHNLKANNYLLYVDIEHIKNSFSNLIDNAIKYSDPENINIQIETKNSDNDIVISFIDSGIGMTQEQINKIFEKFYRVQSGNVHNVKGFGLGLSYVKSIIDMHNGKIKVQSKKGVGSQFDIYIPVLDNIGNDD